MAHASAQTILITGATAGIGRHAALHLAGRGHHVIATGRKRAALDELLAAAPRGSTGRLDVLVLDVTSKASIAEAARGVDALTAGRGLDVLVNNAGFGLSVPVDETTDEDLRALYETNVFGLMAVTRAFLPAMRARGRGRIINISSMGGRLTMPLLGAYASTKFAVESLSDAMRNELAPFGIQVVLIEPGLIKSEFANRTLEALERYRRADSPYAALYARSDELHARTKLLEAGPEVISRAIETAVTARRPRARYVAPLHAKLGLWAKALLPTRVLDWILRQTLGLTRRQLRLPAAPASSASPPPAEVSRAA